MRYLAILLFPLSLFAETTGNLITNGTFENGNSNGWTTSGEVQVLNDCCGSQYDLEIGLSGSISQSFDLTSDTITQPMLNNGITLNSSVLVQSGEGGNGGWCNSCGPADSFTVQLQIKDSDNNVLATTTQERFNVTSITGEVFSDSVAYTQSGSNRGAITLSGTDGAGVVGGLGGPNFDNVEVTMTYDPVVLSVSQTEEINTTLTFVAEVEQEIETIFFEPIEEIRFEEYIEPEVLVSFEEIFIQELATEEINTGIVNIFEEVTYEEPQTIETFSAEIESFETEVETTEITNLGGGFEGRPIQEGETLAETLELGGETELAVREEEVGGTETEGVATEEISGTGNGEASTENEGTVVAQSEQESSERVSSGGEQSRNENTESESMGAEDNQSSETENTVASEEVNEANGETETSQSEQTSEGAETNNTPGELDESRGEEVAESGDSQDTRVASQEISIENIEKRINQTIQSVDRRLVATQLIIAKALQGNQTTEVYEQTNLEIFNQPILDGGEYYETREYIDDRNIYAENQSIYTDMVAKYEEQIQQATDEVIRAEEHLRRIRGY